MEVKANGRVARAEWWLHFFCQRLSILKLFSVGSGQPFQSFPTLATQQICSLPRSGWKFSDIIDKKWLLSVQIAFCVYKPEIAVFHQCVSADGVCEAHRFSRDFVVRSSVQPGAQCAIESSWHFVKLEHAIDFNFEAWHWQGSTKRSQAPWPTANRLEIWGTCETRSKVSQINSIYGWMLKD